MIFVWINLKKDMMKGLVQEVAYLAGNADSQTLGCFICVLKELCACAVSVCVIVCMCVCLLIDANIIALSPFIQILRQLICRNLIFKAKIAC